MTITEKESNKIKEHLLKQLDNFPEEKREQIKAQINSMTKEQVENFVKQNNLTHLGEQCIFCSIIAGKTPSYKIDEDKNNIAILELNPLSKGHSLIIPKKHKDKIKETPQLLLERIIKKIKTNFSPNEIKINEIKIMNHAIIELIPIYGDEKERHAGSEEELKEIQKQLLKIREIKPQKKQITKTEEIPILPPRIP